MSVTDALERLAFDRFALERLAFDRFALERLAFERFALDRLAFERFAFERWAAALVAFERLAFDRFALERLAFDRFALERLAFERFALDRLAFERCAALIATVSTSPAAMESLVPSGWLRSKVSPGGLSVTAPASVPPTSVTFTAMVAGLTPPASFMNTVRAALERAGMGTVTLVTCAPAPDSNDASTPAGGVKEKRNVRSTPVALKAETTKFRGNDPLSAFAFCGEVTNSPSEMRAV